MRPELAALHATWQSIAAGDSLPSRAQIGPESLKPWLRNVELVDIERSPLRFRRRLVGTKIVDYQGTDHTGRYFDEDMSSVVDGGELDDYAVCAERGVPVHRTDRSFDEAGDLVRWERLLLPLARDGRVPDMILVGLFVDVARQRPTLPQTDPILARMREARQLAAAASA
ncbi:MAG: PAS domain-containing protein [Alphaproteobacteria bacterium]